MKNMFPEDVVENTYMYFVISNLFIDVKEPVITDSWVMTVFSKIDGKDYHIDTIDKGLVFEW
jgi:hypothetical protein